jgi:uncharacterized membrane protein
MALTTDASTRDDAVDDDPSPRRRARWYGQAHGIFAVLASLLIGAFVFLIPAGWGLDEQSHVNRAYQIGQGNLLPDALEGGLTYGGTVPRALQDYQMLGHTWSSGAEKQRPFYERRDFRDLDTYRTLGSERLDRTDLVTVEFTNAGASSPLAYTPAAAGFAIASALDLSAGAATILSRLFNALAYIAVVWAGLFALRRLRAQWVFLPVALVPTAIFYAGFVTADTLTNAVSLTFVALCLRAFLDPAWMLRRGPRIGLLAAAVGLALVKPTVVLLVVLVLFLPASGFASVRRAWFYRVGVAGLAVAITGAFSLVVRPISSAIRFQRPDVADQIDPVGQAFAMLGDPLGAVGMFARSLATEGASWLGSAVGFFGYNAVHVGLPIIALFVAVVTVLGLSSERVDRLRGIVLLASGILLALAIIGALYLTFTPIGSPVAEGVQGRYFIPVLLPVVLGAAALLPVRVRMTERTALVISTVASAGSGIVAIVVWQSYLL